MTHLHGPEYEHPSKRSLKDYMTLGVCASSARQRNVLLVSQALGSLWERPGELVSYVPVIRTVVRLRQSFFSYLTSGPQRIIARANRRPNAAPMPTAAP